MGSMNSTFHKSFVNTPSIHMINHHSINWNQKKKCLTSLKIKYQRPLNTKNPSGQMKLKWIPKKNGSNQDKNSIPKSNQNVEPKTKRSPTYKKFPPPSKWSSRKTHKIHGSKHQNSKLHHQLPQVLKIKMATSKYPNIPSMSTIIHHNPNSHTHSKNIMSQIYHILETTLYHKDSHNTQSLCMYVNKVKPSLKENHNGIDQLYASVIILTRKLLQKGHYWHIMTKTSRKLGQSMVIQDIKST